MTITINGNVTINGNIYVNTERETEISKAKDQLLSILFRKRNNNAWGGRESWIKMLDMYFCRQYNQLAMEINSFVDGNSKEKALGCLSIITTQN